jgi:hypothetical protein
MKLRQLYAVLAIVSLSFGAGSPAGASPPIGGCPPAFQGPLTIQQIIAAFPPPPGIPAEALLTAVDLKGNGDGSLCVRPHPDGVRIVVVDNVANAPS